MVRACFPLLLLITGCSAVLLESRTEPADPQEWTRTGDADWRFAGRAIVAGPAETSGFLVSPGRYADVFITVDFRVDDATNSGVFIRCQDPRVISPTDCHEINIWDNHPNQDFRTGSIVTRQRPLAHVETLGRWNTMRIDAVANLVTVSINGVETARLNDDSLTEGHIALQYAGTRTIEFRNLRIEPR